MNNCSDFFSICEWENLFYSFALGTYSNGISNPIINELKQSFDLIVEEVREGRQTVSDFVKWLFECNARFNLEWVSKFIAYCFKDFEDSLSIDELIKLKNSVSVNALDNSLKESSSGLELEALKVILERCVSDRVMDHQFVERDQPLLFELEEELKDKYDLAGEEISLVVQEYGKYVELIFEGRKTKFDFYRWLLSYGLDREWVLFFSQKCKKSYGEKFALLDREMKFIQEEMEFFESDERERIAVNGKNIEIPYCLGEVGSFSEGDIFSHHLLSNLDMRLEWLKEEIRVLEWEKILLLSVDRYERDRALDLICKLVEKMEGRKFLPNSLSLGEGVSSYLYIYDEAYYKNGDVSRSELVSDASCKHLIKIAEFKSDSSILLPKYLVFCDCLGEVKSIRGTDENNSYGFSWVTDSNYSYINYFFDYCSYWLLKDNILKKTPRVYSWLEKLIDPFIYEYQSICFSDVMKRRLKREEE